MPDYKYNIIVIGCAMNKSDSERIAGYLDHLGFRETSGYRDADLVVITTCGVRQSAEDRIYGFVSGIKKANERARILITGCLSKEPVVISRIKDFVDIWLPIDELSALDGKLNEFPEFKNIKIVSESVEDNSYLSLHPKYKSAFSALVPIGNGCDNFCSYCYVPYARGREVYRKAEEIIQEIKQLLQAGYKEITLIAQNVNSYKDGERNFSDLLRSANAIEGDFWIRFATSHPKDMGDDLIEAIAESEKVCHYVHLPAQAGDNEILRRMNRRYTREHYLDLLAKIRYQLDEKYRNYKIQDDLTWMPPVSITTDVIVGFPGETEEQFGQTKELFDEAKYDMAYIGQYSPRPQTVSAKMADDVSRAAKKRREEELMEILRRTALENNQQYANKVVEVLVEGRSRGGEIYGKTRTNKVVKLLGSKKKSGEGLTGNFIPVRIVEVDIFGLRGGIVEPQRSPTSI